MPFGMSLQTWRETQNYHHTLWQIIAQKSSLIFTIYAIVVFPIFMITIVFESILPLLCMLDIKNYAYRWYTHQGGEPHITVWSACLKRKQRITVFSRVTFVSCQQAASGVPKCAICDHQVFHAVMPSNTASDDEKVLEHMTSAFTAGKEPTRSWV